MLIQYFSSRCWSLKEVSLYRFFAFTHPHTGGSDSPPRRVSPAHQSNNYKHSNGIADGIKPGTFWSLDNHSTVWATATSKTNYNISLHEFIITKKLWCCTELAHLWHQRSKSWPCSVCYTCYDPTSNRRWSKSGYDPHLVQLVCKSIQVSLLVAFAPPECCRYQASESICYLGFTSACLWITCYASAEEINCCSNVLNQLSGWWGAHSPSGPAVGIFTSAESAEENITNLKEKRSKLPVLLSDIDVNQSDFKTKVQTENHQYRHHVYFENANGEV